MKKKGRPNLVESVESKIILPIWRHCYFPDFENKCACEKKIKINKEMAPIVEKRIIYKITNFTREAISKNSKAENSLTSSNVIIFCGANKTEW